MKDQIKCAVLLTERLSITAKRYAVYCTNQYLIIIHSPLAGGGTTFLGTATGTFSSGFLGTPGTR